MLAPFDTLAYARKLRAAGFPDAQAEALAEAQSVVLAQFIETRLAKSAEVNGPGMTSRKR